MQKCWKFQQNFKKKKKSVLLVQSKWYASVRKNKVATAVFYWEVNLIRAPSGCAGHGVKAAPSARSDLMVRYLPLSHSLRCDACCPGQLLWQWRGHPCPVHCSYSLLKESSPKARSSCCSQAQCRGCGVDACAAAWCTHGLPFRYSHRASRAFGLGLG